MKRRHDWKNLSLPERVCLTLEALAAYDGGDGDRINSDQVYRFTHIANGSCDHADWLAELEDIELSMRLSYYTSPLDMQLAEQLLAKGLVAHAR